MEDTAVVDLYQRRSMLSASGQDDGVNPKQEMMVWRTKTLARPRRSTHVECAPAGVVADACARARMCQWVCKWRGNLRSECLARSWEMTSPRRKSRTIKMGECCQEEGGAGNKARAIRDEERSRRQAGGGHGDEWTGLVCDEGVPTQRLLIGECRAKPGDDFFFSSSLSFCFRRGFQTFVPNTIETYQVAELLRVFSTLRVWLWESKGASVWLQQEARWPGE